MSRAGRAGGRCPGPPFSPPPPRRGGVRAVRARAPAAAGGGGAVGAPLGGRGAGAPPPHRSSEPARHRRAAPGLPAAAPAGRRRGRLPAYGARPSDPGVPAALPRLVGHRDRAGHHGGRPVPVLALISVGLLLLVRRQAAGAPETALLGFLAAFGLTPFVRLLALRVG